MAVSKRLSQRAEEIATKRLPEGLEYGYPGATPYVTLNKSTGDYPIFFEGSG